MSLVDVTELLGDPDFVGPMQQITRVTQVDGLGQNILTECCNDTFGSIQPISGREIFKIPESMRVANMMTFWIKGVIKATSPGKYSDILVFNGCRFQVMTVNDWSAWGQGYSEGACVAEVPS
jgi:hypothetical protein